MAQVICMGCGAQWTEGSADNYPFLRFATDPVVDEFQENTVSSIIAAGATLLSCPKCPLAGPRATDQPRKAGGTETNEVYTGDDRRTAGDEDQPIPSDTRGTIHRG